MVTYMLISRYKIYDEQLECHGMICRLDALKTDSKASNSSSHISPVRLSTFLLKPKFQLILAITIRILHCKPLLFLSRRRIAMTRR